MLFFPWWVVTGLILIGIFLFEAFYEAIVIALFLDTLYGMTVPSLFRTYLFTISISIVFLVSFWIKEHLSFKQNEMTLHTFLRLFTRRRIGKHEIDPDEIFLDSRNLPDFDVHQFEGRIEKPISSRVFQGVSVVFVLVVVLFVSKLWILQVKQGEAFETRSRNNNLKHTTIFSERGVIYDRNKVELAWNELTPGAEFAARKYINLDGFAHLVGYVKYPSKDSSGNYYSKSFIAKDGVEQYYDQELLGKNGLKLTETDAAGNVHPGKYTYTTKGW